MRNPDRIDRMLGLLRAYWHAHPNLRLGQIVGNFTPRIKWVNGDSDPGNSYYVEDDVIERALREASLPPTVRPKGQ